MGVRELLVGEHIPVLGRGYIPTPQGQKLLSLGTFWTSPNVPLHLTVHLHPL